MIRRILVKHVAMGRNKSDVMTRCFYFHSLTSQSDSDISRKEKCECYSNLDFEGKRRLVLNTEYFNTYKRIQHMDVGLYDSEKTMFEVTITNLSGIATGHLIHFEIVKDQKGPQYESSRLGWRLLWYSISMDVQYKTNTSRSFCNSIFVELQQRRQLTDVRSARKKAAAVER